MLRIDSRQLPDGRWLVLYPLLFGSSRLTVTRTCATLDDAIKEIIDDVWDYETCVGGLKAMGEWTGEGEPTGWNRHPASGRRRPGGDPESEYVRA